MRALNLQKLTDELQARYPGVVIFGIGDAPHKLRISDHNEDDTAGSRAAQSDPDIIPEHRAIDVMLGPAFNQTQAQALVDEILADSNGLARLVYINWLYWQWSASTGWQRRDNGDDPHTDHIHFSGRASQDGNVTNWLAIKGEPDMMALAIDPTTGKHWIGDGVWRRELTPKQYNGWKAVGVIEHGHTADVTVYGRDVNDLPGQTA